MSVLSTIADRRLLKEKMQSTENEKAKGKIESSNHGKKAKTSFKIQLSFRKV